MLGEDFGGWTSWSTHGLHVDVKIVVIKIPNLSNLYVPG